MPVSASDRLVHTQEIWIPRRSGDGEIRARYYRPIGTEENLPVIVYFHPGLFFGTLEMDHARCMRYTSEIGCVVLSVDYRLAPEHPFPAGLDDCYDCLTWLAEAPSELKMDPRRTAVAGCSTGATLAAALALVARDRGGPNLLLQVLICPVLDDRLETFSMDQFSVPEPMEAGRVGSEHTWRYYLGENQAQGVSPYAAPARAESLHGLPPAYVVTAEFDSVRDEGIEYAMRLVRSGVPTELHHFPACFHAFDFVARTAAVSRRAIDEQAAVLRRVLGLPKLRASESRPSAD